MNSKLWNFDQILFEEKWTRDRPKNFIYFHFSFIKIRLNANSISYNSVLINIFLSRRAKFEYACEIDSNTGSRISYVISAGVSSEPLEFFIRP